MTEKLLTPIEVQQLLHISRSTLYRLIQKGQLPVIRVGGTYRIRMSELNAYLEKNNQTEK